MNTTHEPLARRNVGRTGVSGLCQRVVGPLDADVRVGRRRPRSPRCLAVARRRHAHGDAAHAVYAHCVTFSSSYRILSPSPTSSWRLSAAGADHAVPDDHRGRHDVLRPGGERRSGRAARPPRWRAFLAAASSSSTAAEAAATAAATAAAAAAAARRRRAWAAATSTTAAVATTTAAAAAAAATTRCALRRGRARAALAHCQHRRGQLALSPMHMTFLGLLSFGRGDHPGREQRTGTATGRCLLSSRWPSPIRKHMTEHGTRRVAGPEGPHLGGTCEQSARVRPGLRVDRRPRRVASSPSASSASSSRRPPFGPHDLPLNPNQPL